MKINELLNIKTDKNKILSCSEAPYEEENSLEI